MSSHTSDFLQSRSDFPMLQKEVHGHPLIYLDSAATSLKPKVMIDSISNFYANDYGTVHRAVYSTAVYATEAYEASRKVIQKFLHAKDADEIVFCRGTTEAINMVAYSFGKACVQEGDEIILTEMEHHSNIVPWQIMAEDRKAVIKVVPFLESGEVDMKRFKELLSSKTKIVAVAHVSNTLGTINPIEEIVSIAHKAGACVLVDGAQAAPHMPLNMQKLGADFYVFSGHKTLGPTGIGILWAKKELLEELPPYQGGGDMIDHVSFEKTTYGKPPIKFEAGTPLIAEVIGLGASVEYLMNMDLEKVSKFESSLTQKAYLAMKEIPEVCILGTSLQKGSLVTFSVHGAHPFDVATLMDLNGISIRSGHLCAQPVMKHYNITAACRASFAFYNTHDEVDVFIKALKKTVKTLCG